ncbi:hypothetical protein AGMMS50262_18320 [Bacteroidia bacterium]|nr:hypothetical protein AGMMS50262_18320 [Bacteroidia bacterium]
MSKGRNKELIKKRDSALIERWNYWTNVQRLRFDDSLKVLSQTEFFISEERILSILREYNKKEQPAEIFTIPKIKVAKLKQKHLSLFPEDPPKKKP